MPALDTNILVRYLVQDDAKRARKAEKLLKRSITAGEAIFVPITVALELEWVLRSRYGFPKEALMASFSDLLSSIEILFESEYALEIALARYKEHAADFSDCVHLALAMQAGQTPFWTFDKLASTLDGAKLVK